MHSAQIAPLQEAIPPMLYGGTKRVVHWLPRNLLPWGMTLLCSLVETHAIKRNSKLRGRERCALTVRCATQMMLERVRQRADECDFLHFHLDYLY